MVSTAGSAPPSTAVACGGEGQTCTLPTGATATVWYGAGSLWRSKTGVTGSIACGNDVFGDPVFGTAKTCRYVVTATATPPSAPSATPPSTATLCAGENQTCALPTGVSATVWYGAGTQWAFKTGLSGRIACYNGTFGDPAPGVVKSCRYQ